MDDANLATHLSHMCLAKLQTRYDLTENNTAISTRAVLLVLKNIENNVELDAKPPSVITLKGADGKCKMELMDSRIPKRPRGWMDGETLHSVQETQGAAQETQHMLLSLF